MIRRCSSTYTALQLPVNVLRDRFSALKGLANGLFIREEINMGAKCFGEFVGTAVLVLLGNGVLANVLLKKSKAEGAGG
jgi:hypothetical protein